MKSIFIALTIRNTLFSRLVLPCYSSHSWLGKQSLSTPRLPDVTSMRKFTELTHEE